MKRALFLVCVLTMQGCFAAAGVSSGVASSGFNYFKAGDIRLSIVGSFDQSKRAVESAIKDLDFEVKHVSSNDPVSQPKQTWHIRDEYGRAARLVLLQHTSRVGTIHVDIDVLTKGAASNALALLFVDRISLFAESHARQGETLPRVLAPIDPERPSVAPLDQD